MALFGRDRKDNQARDLVPPVDLDVPVENPDVVAAVHALVAEPTSVALSAALDRALAGATLLAAAAISEIVTDLTHPGQAVVPEGSEITLHSALTDDDQDLLALFTDWSSLEAFCGEGSRSLVLPGPEAFAIALKQYDGAVINPAGPGVVIPLPPDVLERLVALPRG